MANIPAPIQEVSRLLDLVPYISTHSHISLDELAREFGVTPKEMAKELTALSMCGLPGYTPYELIEVFFDSGYVTINNHEALDIPRALTNLEISALLIGLEIIRDSFDSSSLGSDELKRLEEKIDSLILQLSAKIGNRIEYQENPQGAGLAILQRAIAIRATVKISYQSPIRDQAQERIISPLSIYAEFGNSYLSSYCHTSQEYRNFRIDRILEIDSSHVSSEDELPATPLNSEESPRITIAARAHSRQRSIAELFHLPGHESFAKDGRFESAIFSTQWLTRAVVAQSPNLELLEPVECRSNVRELLENILSLYRS